MLPLPPPILNGVTLTHAELRALHEVRKDAIRTVTAERCLDGPRLLDTSRGESYTQKAHGRDREGNLLASVTVSMPWSGDCYVRKVRMIHHAMTKAELDAEVARGWRPFYS